MNIKAIVLGFVLVIALFTRFEHKLQVPSWLSPLQLNCMVALLGKMLPWIKKDKGLAVALGYLVVVLQLCNASLLLLLMAMSAVSRWLLGSLQREDGLVACPRTNMVLEGRGFGLINPEYGS
jgi:hypothetical protein